MSSKMLKQDIESRKRTEEFCDIVEEETGFRPSLKQAESTLTEIGLEAVKEKGVGVFQTKKEEQ